MSAYVNSHIAYRIIFALIIAVSVIFGWWYVALPLGLLGLWAFPYYLEFIVAGFVFDALYGMGRELGVVGYLGTILTVLLTGALFSIKILVRR